MKMRLQQAFSTLVRGPNTENFEKKFYRQCELGCGPQHREFRKEILQAMRVGVWAPTQRISKRNSTGNASWCGPQHREIGFPISTDNASWRAPTQKLTKSQLTIMCKLAGPQHRSWRKVSLQ